MKAICGWQKETKYDIMVNDIDEFDLPNKLNEFYCGYDVFDHSSEIADEKCKLNEITDTSPICCDESVVSNVFRKLNPNKACGPNGLTSKILICCRSQLSFIYDP